MPTLLAALFAAVLSAAAPAAADPVAVPASAPVAPLGTVDGAGRPFDLAATGSDFSLVYFGYTHCPEICPTSLFEMKAAIDRLDPAARARITPVFVTLDPVRDTPAVMSAYIAPLGGNFVTVSGTLEVIDRLAWAYQVVVVRNIEASRDYTVDHTTSVLLLGPGGRVVERFPYEMDYREVSRRIAGHLAAAAEASSDPAGPPA
ncbi:SCO family protein [Antarcticirhabdus aurantiaca]|uniref:SCO family protein n=1 Tax=Antarcticirhabdus aurantiaca TaxID=2606717 RepID=A0ACD4NLR6_9HYPH|nr:SCO family protein [Antarcticirhabdus aurantiaca]WAJ27840.1 SCO family protein [Jeongeuplla avenae]